MIALVAVRPTGALARAELADLRALCDAAFTDGFGDDDLDHALGGWHAWVTEAGRLRAHAAVVPRALDTAGRTWRVGYLEAVAVHPDHRRRGLGARAVRALHPTLDRRFELGALSTEAPAFYEQLGWERWRGATAVRVGDVERPTPDEDAGICVRRGGPSADLPLTGRLVCRPRAGDDW